MKIHEHLWKSIERHEYIYIRRMPGARQAHARRTPDAHQTHARRTPGVRKVVPGACQAHATWRGWGQFCMLFTIVGAAWTNFACYLQYLARLGPILYAIYNSWRNVVEPFCMLFVIFGATWHNCACYLQ